VYFLVIVISLVVNTSAVNCLKRLVSEMTSYVLSGTNLIHVTLKFAQNNDYLIVINCFYCY